MFCLHLGEAVNFCFRYDMETMLGYAVCSVVGLGLCDAHGYDV